MNPTKYGRRTSKSNQSTSNLLESPPITSKDHPPEVRGGWAEEGKKVKNQRNSSFTENEPSEPINTYEPEEDIPVIPDIDDIQEDLLTLQEMKVPSLLVNKDTYRELDSELSSRVVSGTSLTSEAETDLSFMEKEVFKKFTNLEFKDSDVWTMKSLLEELIKRPSKKL